MEAYQLAEFNYTYGMIVSGLIEAMAMQAENMQRQHLGQSMAYTDTDFMKIIENNGIGCDALIDAKIKMQ